MKPFPASKQADQEVNIRIRLFPRASWMQNLEAEFKRLAIAFSFVIRWMARRPPRSFELVLLPAPLSPGAILGNAAGDPHANAHNAPSARCTSAHEGSLIRKTVPGPRVENLQSPWKRPRDVADVSQRDAVCVPVSCVILVH